MSGLLEQLQRAQAALAAHDLRAACEAAQVALVTDAHAPEAHAVLGIILSELNDLSSGEWHFRRALELGGLQTDCLVNLGVNLLRQGRAEEAEPCFAQADQLSPGHLQVLAQWSKVREALGDLQGADELLDRAAAASSAGDVELLRVIYLARKGRLEEALAILEAAPELGGEAKLERGRIYDRLGRHEEAWWDWVEGKARLASQRGDLFYPREAVEAFALQMKQFFTRANLDLLPQAPVRADTAQPVFILGFPRSGTTLVERVLTRHSAIRRGGELTFVGEWPRLLERLLPGSSTFPANLARTWSADQRPTAHLMRDYYLARAEERGLLEPGKPYFTDKMPLNEMYLPLIRMAFPQAKIVRVVRHPLDVSVSMLSHELTHGFNCGFKIETIVHQLSTTADLLDHYGGEMELDVFTLRYEDLVHDFAGETQRLLRHIGVAFEPACLAFDDASGYSATPSYAQVTGKLNDRSIERYRHFIGHLEPLLPGIESLLRAHGYRI